MECEKWQGDDREFLRILGSFDRITILGLMRKRKEAAPSELTDETGLAVGSVHRHMRLLAGIGLAEFVREEPTRGSRKHVYKITDMGSSVHREITKLLRDHA